MSQDTKSRGAHTRSAEICRNDATPTGQALQGRLLLFDDRASGDSWREERAAERVADALAPLMNAVFAPEAPVRFEFWDGSGLGPVDESWRREAAIRRSNPPDSLGPWRARALARAYVSGNVDVEGDLYETLRALEDSVQDARIGIKAMPKLWTGAIRLGLFGRPPTPPGEEARQRGRLHSRSRDPEAVSHHYDVGNDFYRTVLGPSMTYSCARFVNDEATLETAQAAKHDLICRKLGLGDRPNMSLARCRVWMGFDGHACGVPIRREGGRHHAQQGTGIDGTPGASTKRG